MNQNGYKQFVRDNWGYTDLEDPVENTIKIVMTFINDLLRLICLMVKNILIDNKR